jgi:hypothetical protein
VAAACIAAAGELHRRQSRGGRGAEGAERKKKRGKRSEGPMCRTKRF